MAARLKAEVGLSEILGECPALRKALDDLPAVARSGFNVLIVGESGTGKELFAHAIHHLSPRAAGPFIPLNCGTIPPELAENELFGHQAGAFTGASRASPGSVQNAAGGTLFLDEIDSLPLPVQVKLLRLLEGRECRPLGAACAELVDLRIVAATNEDLKLAVDARRFRLDLFHRLANVQVKLPPLRDRGRDVELLARHFLQRCARQLGREIVGIADEAIDLLRYHPWPGNVRELDHVIAQAVLNAPPGTPVLGPEHLPIAKGTAPKPDPGFRNLKAQAIERFEAEYLRQLMNAHQGVVAAAARQARMDPRALRRLLKRHGLPATAAQYTEKTNVALEGAKRLTIQCWFGVSAVIEALSTV